MKAVLIGFGLILFILIVYLIGLYITTKVLNQIESM